QPAVRRDREKGVHAREHSHMSAMLRPPMSLFGVWGFIRTRNGHAMRVLVVPGAWRQPHLPVWPDRDRESAAALSHVGNAGPRRGPGGERFGRGPSLPAGSASGGRDFAPPPERGDASPRGAQLAYRYAERVVPRAQREETPGEVGRLEAKGLT